MTTGCTLHAWRERFHARLDEVRALGFDERVIRMWTSTSATVRLRGPHIGNVQLLRAVSRRVLYGEPPVREAERLSA